MSTMKTKVNEALALGPETSIVLTDSQGNVLIDTPGIKGLCCGLEWVLEQIHSEVRPSSSMMVSF